MTAKHTPYVQGWNDALDAAAEAVPVMDRTILRLKKQGAANSHDDLVAALDEILKEATTANGTIRLNRDGGGSGRVKVATATHRIEAKARAALAKAKGETP